MNPGRGAGLTDERKNWVRSYERRGRARSERPPQALAWIRQGIRSAKNTASGNGSAGATPASSNPHSWAIARTSAALSTGPPTLVVAGFSKSPPSQSIAAVATARLPAHASLAVGSASGRCGRFVSLPSPRGKAQPVRPAPPGSPRSPPSHRQPDRRFRSPPPASPTGHARASRGPVSLLTSGGVGPYTSAGGLYG